MAYHDPPDPVSIEPDERWKADLRDKIEQGLIPVVNDAKEALADILAKAPVTELQRDSISQKYLETMSQIRRLAREQFARSLEVEKAKRRLAACKEFDSDLKALEPEARQGDLDAECGIEEVKHEIESEGKLTEHKRHDDVHLRTEAENRLWQTDVQELKAGIRHWREQELVEPPNLYGRPTSASPPSASTRRSICLEPDEAWKADLRDRIEQGLMSMVYDAKAALVDKLAKGPIKALQRESINQEHMEAMKHIRRLAQEQFDGSLEVERAERRLAADEHVDRKWPGLEREGGDDVGDESESMGRVELSWKGKEKSRGKETEYGCRDNGDFRAEAERKIRQEDSSRRSKECKSQERIESDFCGKLTSRSPTKSSTASFSAHRRRSASFGQTASDVSTANEPNLFIPRSADPSAPGDKFSFEAEWSKKQYEEHARQEKLLRKQEHSLPASGTLTKYEVTRRNKIYNGEHLEWRTFPWPMFTMPLNPEDLNVSAIRGYVLSPRGDTTKSAESRIKEELRRWHPDHFESKIQPRVIDRDREKVKDGVGSVVRALNSILQSEMSKPTTSGILSNESDLFIPRSADPSAPGDKSSFEVEWPKKQYEEHTRQEKLRRKQEHPEPASGTLTEYEVTRWNKIYNGEHLEWRSFPWPMFTMPLNPKDLNVSAIRGYVLSPRGDTTKSAESRIKEQLRRWHPDRFESKFRPRVIGREWEKVKDGAGSVVRALNSILETETSKPV